MSFDKERALRGIWLFGTDHVMSTSDSPYPQERRDEMEAIRVLLRANGELPEMPSWFKTPEFVQMQIADLMRRK